MLGRIAVVAASVALAACAGLEPAGRNAGRAPAPPAPVTRTTPPPQQTTTAPQQQTVTPAPQPQATAPAARAPALSVPPQASPTPSAAPSAAAPTPAPQRSVSTDVDDAIVVPGQREEQVRPPSGDPRSTAQRMEDVRAWDQCVIQVQSAFESDPMRPQMTTPEEYCRSSLGMASRTSVPESRRQRQR